MARLRSEAIGGGFRSIQPSPAATSSSAAMAVPASATRRASVASLVDLLVAAAIPSEADSPLRAGDASSEPSVSAASCNGATHWYPNLGTVRTHACRSPVSSRALRARNRVCATTVSVTSTRPHTAAISSSRPTARWRLAIRYARHSSDLGGNGTRWPLRDSSRAAELNSNSPNRYCVGRMSPSLRSRRAPSARPASPHPKGMKRSGGR